MGSSKSSSSDENDGKKARKRSYECTFCKRGFTNAQALGGHMNIHRKDRAKTKQLTSGASGYLVTLIHDMNPNFAGRVRSGQTVDFYPVFEGQRYLEKESVVHGSDENGLIQDRGSDQGDEQVWGENLSLRVASNKFGEVEKEDELDLELRLGRDHYSR